MTNNSTMNLCMQTDNHLLILDGAPGKLLYDEITDLLKQGFNVTMNINMVSNKEEIKNIFNNRVNYVNFDINNKSELISTITHNNLGFNVIKLRLNTPINEEIISTAVSNNLKHHLKVIAQTGVGVNHIDRQAATKYGVFITNTPGSNANAVAEYVIASMLILGRNLTYHNKECHARNWSRETLGLNYFELKGKTLGIIGIGEVAAQLIPKAKALGMEIIAYSTSSITNKTEIEGCRRISDFDNFLSSADVISIHVPLTENTKNLISDNKLRLMKQGAILINTARGGIVDEVALAKILNCADCNIGGVAIDTHEYENTKYNSPLIGLNKVLLTPHIAGTTPEALLLASKILANNVTSILNGNYHVPIVNREIIEGIPKCHV
jgi:phosphoglycerate dehydrogenase-like enzyme